MHSRLNIPAPAGVKAMDDAERKVIRLTIMPSRGFGQSASLDPRPRKVGGCFPSRPYRKPTQVGECKCTQARERNLSKELGTLAP